MYFLSCTVCSLDVCQQNHFYLSLLSCHLICDTDDGIYHAAYKGTIRMGTKSDHHLYGNRYPVFFHIFPGYIGTSHKFRIWAAFKMAAGLDISALITMRILLHSNTIFPDLAV